MCMHMCPPSTCVHTRYVPGLWSEPSGQTTGYSVWERRLGLLLTEFGVEGTKQEGAVFRPQGPPTELQGSWELVCELCSIPVCWGLPA